MRARWMAIWLMLVPESSHAQTPVGEADGSQREAAAPTPVAPGRESEDLEARGDRVGVDDAAQLTGSAAEPSDRTASDAPHAEPSAPAPKVVVVVAGDADPLLRAAALEVEARLLLDDRVRLPADPGMRAALRGEDGPADDGLQDLRRDRRSLGGSERDDAPRLVRLGRRAGALLVLVVREGAQGPEAVAFDVSSGQFYEGTLSVAEAEPSTLAEFVVRRARAAARRARQARSNGSGERDRTAAMPASATRADPPAEAPDWLSQNWAYLAAGGLLAAAIVFVVVSATQHGDPPPMLRFRSGPD